MANGWGPSGSEIPAEEPFGFGAVGASARNETSPKGIDVADAIKRWPPQGKPPQELIDQTPDRR